MGGTEAATMNDSNALPQILWLGDLPKRPLCDVPWMGNTVVLANGDVNFCCFSEAVVGNVKHTPLKEIWNNETMRRIRRGLREQYLPPECRSSSCPIFRGDENHVILTRMDGAYRERLTGTAEPHADKRAGFAASCLKENRGVLSDAGPVFDFDLRYEGAPVCVDLYVAIRAEDRVVRFLPRLEEVPIPHRVGVRLPSDSPLSVRWPTGGDAAGRKFGSYDVCGAVFESGSHPNISSNCYWFATARLIAGGPEPDPGLLAGRSVE
jgi:radical SAM protein with 4Fe4S-binding SPASM domain